MRHNRCPATGRYCCLQALFNLRNLSRRYVGAEPYRREVSVDMEGITRLDAQLRGTDGRSIVIGARAASKLLVEIEE